MNIRKWILICLFSFNTVFQVSAQERAAWLREARLGVMVHYLADWQARVNKLTMTPELWNQMVNAFDVEALAKQIDSAGAAYLIFTIGQNSGYYAAPNQTYERLTGQTGHCAKRDLITELSVALHKRNIALIVYLPSGAPAGDSTARTALQWRNGPYLNKEFQVKWESIIQEWSKRWGAAIDGWWFDGCYWPNIMYRNETAPNFASFAAAARAGNRKSIVAFNPGVVYRTLSITPHEDYIAGEIDKPELISIKRNYAGKVDDKQLHMLSFLGNTWGMGEPRFTDEQIKAFSRQVTQWQGAVTWDVPVQQNGTIYPVFMPQLISLGSSIRRIK